MGVARDERVEGFLEDSRVAHRHISGRFRGLGTPGGRLEAEGVHGSVFEVLQSVKTDLQKIGQSFQT